MIYFAVGIIYFTHNGFQSFEGVFLEPKVASIVIHKIHGLKPETEVERVFFCVVHQRVICHVPAVNANMTMGFEELGCGYQYSAVQVKSRTTLFTIFRLLSPQQMDRKHLHCQVYKL